jgi:RNA polymerase sigma factor (sigma-70 family)
MAQETLAVNWHNIGLYGKYSRVWGTIFTECKILDFHRMFQSSRFFNPFFCCFSNHKEKFMTLQEFSYTVNQKSKDLKFHALRFTKDVEDANDLLQETMLKAISNRDKFKYGTNLKAWLYTIMKNTFITNYQKMNRRNTFIDTTDNLHFINDSNYVAANYGESSFVLKDINNAINKLDDAYRTPFLMHFRGFKYHEIAEKLDIPIGTVKNRIHIARKEMKDTLKDYRR